MAEHQPPPPPPQPAAAAIAIDVLDMDADAAAADRTAANHDAVDADDSEAGWSSPAPARVDLVANDADAGADAEADADADADAAEPAASAAVGDEDAAAPTTVAAAPAPAAATEGEVAQLRAMFPDIPATTLRRVLANHYGHTGLAIDALMELQFYQQDVDDESARRRYRQEVAPGDAGPVADEPAAPGAGAATDGAPSAAGPPADPASAADAALAKLRLGDSAAAPPAFYAAAGAVPAAVPAAAAADADEPAPTPSAALSAAKATAEAVKSLLWRRPTPISATTTRANKAVRTRQWGIEHPPRPTDGGLPAPRVDGTGRRSRPQVGTTAARCRRSARAPAPTSRTTGSKTFSAARYGHGRDRHSGRACHSPPLLTSFPAGSRN